MKGWLPLHYSGGYVGASVQTREFLGSVEHMQLGYLRSGVLIARPTRETFAPVDCWFRLHKDTKSNKKKKVKDRKLLPKTVLQPHLLLRGLNNQVASTLNLLYNGQKPAAGCLPCLLSLVLAGEESRLPPTLLLRCLLLASMAFLAEFRMASVLRDICLLGKRSHKCSKELPSTSHSRWEDVGKILLTPNSLSNPQQPLSLSHTHTLTENTKDKAMVKQQGLTTAGIHIVELSKEKMTGNAMALEPWHTT